MKKYNELFEDDRKYLAHLPKNGDQKKAETLLEHSELVLTYVKKICTEFGLSCIIKRLVLSSLGKDASSELGKIVITLFYKSIYYHDFGKINPNFQAQKMKNSNFKQKQLEFGSDHSFPGTLMFINICLTSLIENKELQQKDRLVAVFYLFFFSHQITRHHSSFLSNVSQYIKEKLDFSDSDEKVNLNQVLEILNELETIAPSKYWDTISKGDPKSGVTWINEKFKKIIDTNDKLEIAPFPLFALLKLHFSLLTASDYLATTHYMNNWETPLNNFGTISKTLRERVVKNVRTSKDYNKKVFEVLDGHQFSYPTKPNNENLNLLRQELSVEIIQNIRKNKDRKIFYIEAPTGGGKTNLSMLAAAELMEQNTEISNLYYVFPFTTLITQTYDVLKKTMGLDENEIIQLHSKEGFKEKEGGEYGQEKKNHIDYLFLNYPVALMSHVKFFEILKTNNKSANYLLHRLANSIVIVDELQSYPPKIWDKLIYLIQNYAEYFNIRFILMSATLPKLDKLSNAATNICYLTNHRNQIFQNPNFCNRVEFDFSLLSWPIPEKEEKEDYLHKLAKVALDKSIAYASQNKKYPDSVFTIIEFIYKQTATQFYSITKEISDGFFDNIFVLSGTILEPRRKEIIQYLKNKKNRSKKVILITTQVVEAGVDIDMDLGFKDKSLVDSDEQLAGRINRNVNKTNCKLYLFKCDNAEVLYKGDQRFQLMQHELSGLEQEILKSKNFDLMYDQVMAKIDIQNKRTYQQNFYDFKTDIQHLNFPEVDNNFKIINQQSTSVFVPLTLPIKSSSGYEQNFSTQEILFMVKYQIIKTGDTEISGKEVFDLYERLILQKKEDFIAVNTELKKLSGIMSQFIFSLMTHSKSMEKLILGAHGEERLGMYYLSHWEEDKVYDYEFGLAEKNESAIIF